MTELKTFFNIEIGVFRKSCPIKNYGFIVMLNTMINQSRGSIKH
ncbi:hypothetical protein lpa_03714 [Legionella pneumophila 2300/99 Alcoy]|nr:hypothetical protein lpa_03714 [Legionella pneumophila 2300/99 Alcoy]